MPGKCLICDRCGAELSMPEFNWARQAQALAKARSLGWQVPERKGFEGDANGEDLCPACVEKNKRS